MNLKKVEEKQCLLRITGYYDGPVDGIAGPATREATDRFISDLTYETGKLSGTNTPISGNDGKNNSEGQKVLVFSLATDGNKYLSKHFQVKEFACNDGSDVVLIDPILPVWAEALRTINGAFKPNSSYRTVSYNASIKDASPKSKHCMGIAMDVPAFKATPQELYDLALTLVGDKGGLGIYDWGIHIDNRRIKSRWDYRGK